MCCAWCGEPAHAEPTPTLPEPRHMARAVRKGDGWEPPAGLAPAGDVPANALGTHPDGRPKSQRGWH